MSAEVQNRMLEGIEGPGPGGGPTFDGLDWGSSLFDELSSLVDVEDVFQDGKCNAYENNFDNLDFNMDLMSWDSYPWDGPDQCYTDGIKPEPLSPSSSSSYAQSSLSAGSPASSSECLLEEVDISSSNQMSPVSLYSEASRSPGSPEQLDVKPIKTTQHATSNASTRQRKLAPVVPKLSIQQKAILIPTSAGIHSSTGISSKTIIFQPLTTLLPKQHPLITIQPAPQAGQQVLLAPSAVVQLPAPGIVASQPVLTVSGGTPQIPTQSINIMAHTGPSSGKTSPMKSFIQATAQTPDSGADINLMRRQQRMIKNRESAFQSRRKKKEYMQGLEVRLRAALSENEMLKKENGSLQKLLEEVVSENQKLKVTAPKRRAVCLLMVALFLVINFNPISILQSSPGPFDVEVSTVRHNRHLLEFSSGEINIKDQETPHKDMGNGHYISTEKALMVVKKEPLLYIPPPPPCRPHINQTESLRLNQELRGWVHRHEVERTKSRRTISTHKAQPVQKPDEKDGTSQLVTMQYTSVKNSVNELQIYYSSPRSYQEFLEAIRRRGDTFYVVSFRRDHLLLPATNRNKTSRPKMSIVLPSTTVNENVINGQEYEVMMQIDCEVMDTRILHVKSASIPPFLREHRENQTNTFYNSASSSSEQAHVVSTIAESPL
ncbi:cyclic AMP-dependent transcription factor ATF-6 alpha isoform X2 [Pseudophryne corroboree]|uniref:cyclic AMP-dependent transcription factor ATF-6 alpha isoform X2 n=1 Tax=Pseudophryne corroboree TaxID=495146 RepID=UPI003081CD71